MTRQHAITTAAQDVAEAADYAAVGTEDVLGRTITTADIDRAVTGRVQALNELLALTDAQWDARWAASVAEEARVEADCRKFSAGKA